MFLPHPSNAGWVDEFLEEAAAFPTGRYDDQVDAMTQALIRLRSTEAFFTVPESRFTINPYTIPEGWPRVFAMTMMRDRVVALWAARDPNGTICLYAEHQLPHTEPSENARAIKAQGDWIPGIINCFAGSIAEHYAVAQMYQSLGLKVEYVAPGPEAGMAQFWQLLATNKLKVFASLSMFLSEYRIGDYESPFLRCCQALLLSGRDRMRTKYPKIRVPIEPTYHGPQSWMA